MPRILTSNAETKIATTLGTEPINVVKIFWNDNPLAYADRDFADIKGKILELSNLDEVIKLQGSGISASISITLDDTDGSIKALLDTVDIQKLPCKVYQAFDGLSEGDWFVLFEGEISSPIVWTESQRTVSFEVLNQIESNEAGFAPEEGQFPNIENSEPWPMGFGTVVHVPATKITQQLTSSTTGPLVIVDPTLQLKLVIMNRAASAYSASWTSIRHQINNINDSYREPVDVIPNYAQIIVQEDQLKQTREDIAEQLKVLEKALDTAREDLDNTVEPVLRDDLNIEINNLLPQVNSLKADFILASRALLETLWNKKLTEIEIDNLEYKFQYIGFLLERARTALINYIKAYNEAVLIAKTIEDQSEALVTEIGVVNGDKFPQDVMLSVLINGMRFEGHFESRIFKIHRPLPMYTDLTITPDEEDTEVFYVSDATVNLKGMYGRLPDNKIFKIREQIGTKCWIDPSVNKDDQYDMDAFADPQNYYENLEDIVNKYKPDLFPFTLSYLINASEHTTNERERILLDALDNSYYGEQIEAIADAVEALSEPGITKADQEAIDKALAKNQDYLKSILSNLILPDDLRSEIGRKVSDDEYENLKRLEILQLSEEQRTRHPPPIVIEDVQVPYFSTATWTEILEVSPVILPHWIEPYLTMASQFFGGAITTNSPIFHIPDTEAWIAQAGSDIRVFDGDSDKYVANILPSEVTSVYAYRNIGGIRQLAPVPETYYSVNESESFGNIKRTDDTLIPLVCTTISLHKPLADYSEGWVDDALYVSYASSIGPNTVDIIEYLLETYSSVSIDEDSFDHVSDRLTNFPSSFVVFDRRQVLDLVQDICWQARCSIIFKNDVAYLTYLPEEPTPIYEITEEDVVQGSLKITYTETEDLVTKFIAKWRRNYSEDKPIKTIVRHNINKYGVQPQEYDFFIYNTQTMIDFVATFWSMRLSNTWKIIEFDTFLTTLGLQTLDPVVLNITPNFYADAPLKCLVDKVEYDSSSQTVKIKVWVPVRSGEMTQYPFVWPADLPIETIYPTVEEIAAGDAGNPFNLNVGQDIGYEIDPDNGFFNTPEGQEPRPKDYGKIQLSDLSAPETEQVLSEILSVNRPNVALRKYDGDVADTVLPKAKTEEPSAYQSKSGGKKTETDKQIERLQTYTAYGLVALTARVKDKVDDTHYNVEFQDGRILSAFVIGTDVSDIAEGTVVTVTYNENTREYEFQAPKTQFEVQYFKVEEELHDVLKCKKYDPLTGTTSGNSTYIAKPYVLRQTTFHGNSIVYPTATITYDSTAIGFRTASQSGEEDETQRIIPPYYVNEIILAVKNNPNVTVDAFVCSWEDVNTAAKAWSAYSEEA